MSQPRYFSLLFGLILVGVSSHAWAAASLKVVTTIPVLKEFVEHVGQHHVDVVSLIRGFEDGHSYAPKPSDIMAVRHARLFVTIGSGLEIWVDPLLKNAKNPSLHILVTSKGIPLLKNTGAMKAEHPRESMGNPHIWLDPENAKHMVRHITTSLIALDAENRKDYLANQAEYLVRLDTLQTTLKGVVKGVPDTRFISHHPAWPYFARRFGFTIVGNIIEQPGAEPSAKQLRKLARMIKRSGIKVIVSEPQLNPKLPQILANETGAHVVTLTPLPGAIPGTDTYTDMLAYNVTTLARALQR